MLQASAHRIYKYANALGIQEFNIKNGDMAVPDAPFFSLPAAIFELPYKGEWACARETP